MVEAFLKICVAHRFEKCDPALMQCREQHKRGLDGPGAVRQFGPGGFIVGLDGWPVLGERQFKADVGVDVAVGDVMDELAHGPSAVAVRRVKLGVAQAFDCGAKLPGKLAQRVDVRGSLVGEGGGRRTKASDRIAKIV